MEALTEGVRSVAGGALDTRVPATGSGEVRVLVDAFNRMAEDLGHATRALRAAEQAAAWEGVARSLAHELRNPLTPLQMSLETLLAARKARDGRFEALFVESAPAMLEEVERLRRTIDAFARFARLPAAQLEPLDLTAWTEQALGLAGARPGVALRWEPGPPLAVRAESGSAGAAAPQPPPERGGGDAFRRPGDGADPGRRRPGGAGGGGHRPRHARPTPGPGCSSRG